MTESSIGQKADEPAFTHVSQKTKTNLRARALQWLPAGIAILFFAAFSVLVLSQSEKMIEPDPYAYRASIAALEDGRLSLTQTEYDALSLRLQQTSLGGGIMQWHQNDDGSWVSEKNPGYPFLAIGFDEVGALRLAPLFYGALACIAMWFGARRWLGRWGGTFAVGAYCSTALAMVMAWRSTMPTFTDASLIAAGLGLLVWSAVAIERSRRARTTIGALAFFSFGLAIFVRYTSIVVLGVAALFALAICLRPKWKLGWDTLLWWAFASIPPLVASLAYNAVIFDGPFSTGYNSSSVQFSTGAIPENFRIMPGRLWQAMPIFALGLLAIVVLLGIQITAGFRNRNRVEHDKSKTESTPELPIENTPEVSAPVALAPLFVDRWIGALLALSWAAVWATYAAYEWTTQIGGRQGPFQSRPADMVNAMPSVYITVRFYLPAIGAIALLVAWLFSRVPPWIGITALLALFFVGRTQFIETVNSPWTSMSVGRGLGQDSDQSGGPGTGQRPPGASEGSRPPQGPGYPTMPPVIAPVLP